MLTITTLEKKVHNRNGFDCGVEELNKFLREKASSGAERFISGTKVLTDDEKPSEIIGFYTLSYSEIKAPEGSKLYKGYPSPLPVLRLCRMAVSSAFQRQEFGTQLLIHVISEFVRCAAEGLGQAPLIGIVVDAKADAQGFYEKFGFLPVDPAHPGLLWLPTKTCMQLMENSAHDPTTESA